MRCPLGPYFIQVKGYPANPKSIGEAIRKRRLDLKLRQVDVAQIIGCDEMSIVNWEKGHTTPAVDRMAGVIQFLGYNPLQSGDTVGERFVAHRKSHGLTQKEFARKLGVDPCTLSRWERNQRLPKGNFLELVKSKIE